METLDEGNLKEYQDAYIFAVAPHNRCVGIKIFPESFPLDLMSNVNAEDYIEQCVARALELKSTVEMGTRAIENDRQIILNPSTEHVDRDFLIKSLLEQLEKKLLIKQENHFIDLGIAMCNGAELEKFEFDIIKISLIEIFEMTKKELTPLMLKKNPEYVRGTEQLCRYAPPDITKVDEITLERYQKIRNLAAITLNGFKKVMGFIGTNENFLQWFNDIVELFHELTANIAVEDRRQLTCEPKNVLTIWSRMSSQAHNRNDQKCVIYENESSN